MGSHKVGNIEDSIGVLDPQEKGIEREVGTSEI